MRVDVFSRGNNNYRMQLRGIPLARAIPAWRWKEGERWMSEDRTSGSVRQRGIETERLPARVDTVDEEAH